MVLKSGDSSMQSPELATAIEPPDRCDLIVIGAGPAGCAAAITAATSGLQVLVVERTAGPRSRPGETLHPGIEKIIESLGILEEFQALSAIRHAGIVTIQNAETQFNAYGHDKAGAWRGYQVNRAGLDRLLIHRALQLGVRFIRPGRRVIPLFERHTVAGIKMSGRAVLARTVIDASGATRWIARHLGHTAIELSEPLIAAYGYVAGEGSPNPIIKFEDRGWTWIAQTEAGRIHWARLRRLAERDFEVPAALAGCQPVAPITGRDVTWTLGRIIAGPGYLIVGDAAGSLDPAASHGVLRALMSGIAAAHAASAVVAGHPRAGNATRDYIAWFNQWILHDAKVLAERYRHAALRPPLQFWPERAVQYPSNDACSQPLRGRFS